MQQLVLAVYERFLNPRQKYYWIAPGTAGYDGAVGGGGGGGGGGGRLGGFGVGGGGGGGRHRGAGLSRRGAGTRNRRDVGNHNGNDGSANRNGSAGDDDAADDIVAFNSYRSALSATSSAANRIRERECEQLLGQIRARKRTRGAVRRCAF